MRRANDEIIAVGADLASALTVFIARIEWPYDMGDERGEERIVPNAIS